jgi:hypothetical protein
MRSSSVIWSTDTRSTPPSGVGRMKWKDGIGKDGHRLLHRRWDVVITHRFADHSQ